MSTVGSANGSDGAVDSRLQCGKRRRNHALRTDSKDTDGNYLAVCRAPEAAENGLRLDALGNLISITVLTSVDHQHVPLAQVPFGQLLQNPRRRLDGLPRDLRLAGARLVGQRG